MGHPVVGSKCQKPTEQQKSMHTEILPIGKVTDEDSIHCMLSFGKGKKKNTYLYLLLCKETLEGYIRN